MFFNDVHIEVVKIFFVHSFVSHVLVLFRIFSKCLAGWYDWLFYYFSKVIVAQRKLREQEEGRESGTQEHIEHTHVKAVEKKKKTERKRSSFRERKRIAKKETLQKTKESEEKKSESVKENKSDKDS